MAGYLYLILTNLSLLTALYLISTGHAMEAAWFLVLGGIAGIGCVGVAGMIAIAVRKVIYP